MEQTFILIYWQESVANSLAFNLINRWYSRLRKFTFWDSQSLWNLQFLGLRNFGGPWYGSQPFIRSHTVAWKYKLCTYPACMLGKFYKSRSMSYLTFVSSAADIKYIIVEWMNKLEVCLYPMINIYPHITLRNHILFLS